MKNSKTLLNRSTIAYIEDILLYSATLEDHVHYVRTVLTCLLQNQLHHLSGICHNTMWSEYVSE